MAYNESDDVLKHILKRFGKTKLDLLESIPEITVVEGDNVDTWHIVVTRKYRGMQYGKELSEFEILKQLDKIKAHYRRLMNQVQREIDWINGD